MLRRGAENGGKPSKLNKSPNRKNPIESVIVGIGGNIKFFLSIDVEPDNCDTLSYSFKRELLYLPDISMTPDFGIVPDEKIESIEFDVEDKFSLSQGFKRFKSGETYYASAFCFDKLGKKSDTVESKRFEIF